MGRSGTCKWEADLAKLAIGRDELIGTAIDQKPTDASGGHRVGCRTAMWKKRRNHCVMISKQHDESILVNKEPIFFHHTNLNI